MTVLVATTVHRGSRKGEAHGGLFLVDLERQRGAQAVAWTRPAIDWSGHGGGRGLRGIAAHGERLYVASSEEVLAFGPDFALLAAHRSPYLRHAQALACFESRLYVASAAYDSILAFDLEAGRFDWGLHLVDDEAGLRGTPFNPQGALGPSPVNRLHLNSLDCDSRGMFICGLRTMGLLRFDGKRIKRLVTLPEGVRDARPWRDGVLFNDTAADAVRFLTPQHNRVFRVPHYPAGVLEGEDDDVARQGFARGLCVIGDGAFAAGSSPPTVTLHDIEEMKSTLSINFSTDVRQAIHSLAVWPFELS